LRSYIKIIGPPIHEALLALKRIAEEMPEVSHREVFVETRQPDFTDMEATQDFLGNIHLQDYPVHREGRARMIKRAEPMVGNYDFYFEWIRKPGTDDLMKLIKRIDAEFTRLGCKYTITTKR
jgi:hypothetical protein